jgi:hypothetical protein
VYFKEPAHADCGEKLLKIHEIFSAVSMGRCLKIHEIFSAQSAWVGALKYTKS